jgi:hypothetical protein
VLKGGDDEETYQFDRGASTHLGVTSVKEKMRQMLPELVEEGFVRFQVVDTPSQKVRKLPPSEYFSCGGYNANRILDAMV